MVAQHFILFILWLVYGFLHSWLAAPRIKRATTLNLRISERSYRMLYNVFAVLSLVAVLWYQFTIPGYRFFNHTSATLVLALVLIVPGILIMVLTIIKYFPIHSGLARQPTVKDKLQTSGLHKYCRHPLYLGTMSFLLGLFFLFPTSVHLVAVFVIVGYTLAGTILEEKKLVMEFEDQYIEYQQRVPMFLPSFRKAVK